MRAARRRLCTKCKPDTVLVALVALLLAGCGDIQVKESKIEQTLPQQVAPVVVGQSDRASVRALLGAPWLSSNYWRFDVFRTSDKNSQLMLIFVPVMYSTEKYYGYVVVNYDDRGTVAAVDQGVTREGDMMSYTYPKPVLLQAGDVRFWASADGDLAYLAVTAGRGDQYLSGSRPDGRCRVFFGSPDAFCGLRATVDGTQELTVPGASLDRAPFLAPLQVTAGKHDLRFTADDTFCALETRIQLSCAAGETQFANVTIAKGPPKGTWDIKQKYSAEVSLSRDKPESLRDQGLLVYMNGRWLLPQEPNPQNVAD